MSHVTVPEDSNNGRFETVVGGTPQTEFPFTFPFFDVSEIILYQDGVVVDPNDYVVTGTGSAVDDGYSSGLVTFDVAVSNCTIVGEREVALARTEDFQYPSPTVNIRALNLVLDRFIAIFQQFRRTIVRSLRQPVGDTAEIDTLPAVASRATKVLAFDADGDPVASTLTLAALEAQPAGAAANAAAAAVSASDADTARAAAVVAKNAAEAAQGLSEDAQTAAEAAQAAAEAAAAGIAAASETVAGSIGIATSAETTTGTDDSRALTPKKLTEFAPATATVDTASDEVIIRDASDSKLKRVAASSLVRTIDVVHLRAEYSSGTNGGGSTTGSWQTRPLNTEAVDTGNNCTLSSNQFALLAGTYEIDARAVFLGGDAHQLRIQNITDTSTVLLGEAGQGYAGYGQAWSRHVRGRFTLAGTKTLELQYRVGASIATNGLGIPSSWGTEVYADVWIRKVA